MRSKAVQNSSSVLRLCACCVHTDIHNLEKTENFLQTFLCNFVNAVQCFGACVYNVSNFWMENRTNIF